MNERQSRFVDHYIATANASEAARKAGYSERTARVIGQENLTKPAVQAAIKERLKEMESERVATTQEALEHLTAVLRGEVKETIVTPAGKKFVVPVRESDRLRAVENLLKVFGAYKDKMEVKMSGADLFVSTLEKISIQLEDDKRGDDVCSNGQ